jgi:hypothetical protein
MGIPTGPQIYQALAIKHGLKFYIKTGRKINTAYTPAGMARTARNITGKPVRSTDLPGCLKAIEDWLVQSVRHD